MKKILKVRHYKAGYEIREEIHDGTEYGGKDFTIKSAYTPQGDYIGDSKTAFYLCKKRGIRPEKNKAEHCVCSIGWCEKEQKWYGWSHRAIHGFSIGSKVKKGDCAYTPTDKKDFEEDMVRFWHNPENQEYTQAQRDVLLHGELGVKVFWKYTNKIKNKKLHGKISSVFNPYPDKYGRGEWKALTLKDAKQMAVDFAEGVS